MKIVIDIDEDIYNRFTHNGIKPRCEITEKERFQMGADAIRLTRAFCNGIPLPKHYGDLADKGDIIHDIDCDEKMRLGKNVEWVREVIRNAPTIIKASEEGAVG